MVVVANQPEAQAVILMAADLAHAPAVASLLVPEVVLDQGALALKKAAVIRAEAMVKAKAMGDAIRNQKQALFHPFVAEGKVDKIVMEIMVTYHVMLIDHVILRTNA